MAWLKVFVSMAQSSTAIALLASFCTCVGLGCTETPLDATWLEGGAPGDEPGLPLCPTATPEEDQTYLLVAKTTGACLRAGSVTRIEQAAGSATGYSVEFSP